ncbi:MAG: RnfABCDGE type electron transport complex subunit B [Lachnospiraceae bacterium]|nr:RnfABCDGE type electron transport complex subunit B [Lachnospiraceae bacterium]
MGVDILFAAAMVGGVGLFVGIFLSIAGKRFAVEVDEREAAVIEALPGANCGACGYSGCAALAAAIVKGEAPVNACVVGQAPVAEAVADIMGGDADTDAVRMVAFVHCIGDCENTADKYDYSGGETSCSVISFSPGKGPKSCAYGCMGYGDCVNVCEYGAISIVNGIAKVDPDKCVDCKKCIKTCPKKVISEVPYDKAVAIGCASIDRGKPVIDACKLGCIACTKCVQTCPKQAIEMQGNIPVIDYDKCVKCGLCKKNCPRKCIV